MDLLKEAFIKIKEDISLLQLEITSLKQEIVKLNNQKSAISNEISPSNSYLNPPMNLNPTVIQSNNPTIPQETGGLYKQENSFSTGNRGVPTDNSTYRQTDPQTVNNTIYLNKLEGDNTLRMQETLESLDIIRKELRLKFKRLTPQEMLVFTTLYSLENEGIEEITYKILATHLNLSESSIRDYTTKLLSKGIPLKKVRLNNKKIVLSISSDLKKMTSLSTLIKLREL